MFDRQVLGADPDNRADIGPVVDQQDTGLAFGHFLQGDRIRHHGAGPQGTVVQAVRTAGIKLRAELGHSVFVDHLCGGKAKLFAEHRVELGTCDNAAAAFVSSGFHGGRASRKNDALRPEGFGQVEKAEGGAE